MTQDLDERLARELGGAAYRMPPPPLTDIHRRAGRRRRARLARRGAGAAALVTVAAFAVAGFPGAADRPVAPEGSREPRSMTCGPAAATAAELGSVRQLPEGTPSGPAYVTRQEACSDVLLTAWREDPGTHRMTQWLQVGSRAYGDEPGDGCDRFDGEGQQPGECGRLTVAGQERWVLRISSPDQRVVWAEGRPALVGRGGRVRRGRLRGGPRRPPAGR
jgi:hypothetical protein